MPRIVRSSIWLLVLLAAFPGRVLGQEGKAGIATVIEGDVTARRASLPRPVALRFRDDVLLHDTISTAERSLARLLLGGKAIVTVRERSYLTVTESPGTSLVDLGEGKVGLAVLRKRMRPGDVVQIRTPNAIIAVRGTVVIAEIVPALAPGGAASTAIQSNVYVLTGKVEVQELRNGVPVGPVYPVGRRQMITISPFGPPQVTSIPDSQVAAITAGLQPKSVGPGGSAAHGAAKETALRAAASDLSEGSPDDEERRREDWFVRAPIEPTLPALPGESPAAPAPAPAVSTPVPTLTRSPSLVAPPPPPVSGPSRVRSPIPATPPPVVSPGRAAGGVNSGGSTGLGSATLRPFGAIAVPPSGFRTFTGAAPTTQSTSPKLR